MGTWVKNGRYWMSLDWLWLDSWGWLWNWARPRLSNIVVAVFEKTVGCCWRRLRGLLWLCLLVLGRWVWSCWVGWLRWLIPFCDSFMFWDRRRVWLSWWWLRWNWWFLCLLWLDCWRSRGVCRWWFSIRRRRSRGNVCWPWRLRFLIQRCTLWLRWISWWESFLKLYRCDMILMFRIVS